MGRRALVTGGSRGIGAAIALALGRDGHRVVVGYHTRREAALEVCARIREAGGEAEAVGFDVADRDAVHAALAALQPEEDPFGIVVNNAGVARDGLLATMTPEAWALPLRTTLDGFFHVTQPLLLPMIRQRWGRIVNIASIAGTLGNRGQVNYAAAKAGLIGATKALALELAKRGVTVNAVAPGLIDTDMLEGAPVAQLLEAVPMRRLGTPEEVAGLVAWLARDEAAYLTGQVITVGGGLG
ncbi:MAG: 3-oxoacyl-ACP reductase FabG [Alphaproteobacteria bacterium]|nr:3-oxoacyl-ACP reductase FabG [Alphaproteobacteria bacterium]